MTALQPSKLMEKSNTLHQNVLPFSSTAGKSDSFQQIGSIGSIIYQYIWAIPV